MDIKIRQANINDLNSIQELNNKLFKKEYKEYDSSLEVGWTYSSAGENYFKNIIKNNYAVVAVDKDKIIGYLAGNIHMYGSYTTKLAELENMFVKPEYRNRKIGSKMIEKFINYCKEQGITEIRVTAYLQNEQAIEFYKKHGFQNLEVILNQKI